MPKAKQSAGILLYSYHNGALKFFLVHPGGPFFARKDAGAWTIPKGEFEEDEKPLDAALREFKEEVGIELTPETIHQLTPIKQKSGKVVYAWAVEGEYKPITINSNLFTIEWPPKTGKMQDFPEVDKGEWFTYEEAVIKINSAQIGLLDEVVRLVTRP